MHTLAAVARDSSVNLSITSLIVTVSNTNSDALAPTVSLVTPTPSSTVGGTTVAITVSAADNIGVVGVQFKVDGINLGSEVTTAPYTMSWNSKLVSNGAHTLTAVDRDAGGNQAISLPSTVTVNNPDMTVVSIKAPASGSLVSGSVTVLASATGAVVGVQFKLDGVNLGSEITTAPYSMTWNTAGVLTGNHILTAVARDSAGIQTTSPGILVTAGPSPPIGPRITINSPNHDAVVAGSTIVSIDVTGSAPAASVQISIDGVKYGPEMTQ